MLRQVVNPSESLPANPGFYVLLKNPLLTVRLVTPVAGKSFVFWHCLLDIITMTFQMAIQITVGVEYLATHFTHVSIWLNLWTVLVDLLNVIVELHFT